MLRLSDDLIEMASDAVIDKTIDYLEPASIMVEMSSRFAERSSISLSDNDELEAYAIEVIKSYPQLAMFNIADERGNFLMPKKLPDGTIATKIINRDVDPPTVTWKYRDASGKVIKTEKSTNVKYDARVRPWYQSAKKLRGVYWSDIYIMFTDRKPGITAACPVFDGSGNFWGVFGLDIELSEISAFLSRLKIGNTGLAFIINHKNEIVAYPDITRIVKKDKDEFRPVNLKELDVEWGEAFFQGYTKRKDRNFVFDTNRKRYLGTSTEFPQVFRKDWKIITVVPEDDFIGVIKRTNRIILIISLVLLAIAIIFAVILSHSISKPIILLAEGTKKIKDFLLDDKIEVKSTIKEIQIMVNAISVMKKGLQAFRKYVPAGLVRQLIQTGEEARLGGRKQELTVFFSDITGFTEVAGRMQPESLMIYLSEYFNELTNIIKDQKGTIDKYIGDSVMAFWGAPIWNEDHAYYACRAALLCQKKIDELNCKWESERDFSFPTRIGINTGITILGNVGSEERMNYTVVGDNVNMASHMEKMNKTYGTKIIVSQNTYDKVSDRFLFRPIDIIAPKGENLGVSIYELLGEKGKGIPPDVVELRNTFMEGFDYYVSEDWDKALKIFRDLLKKFPSDEVSRIYIKRCENFKKLMP